jgi:flavin-dependent dehydrogenase
MPGVPILVLGAGPAGTAAALGLVELGHDVTVIHSPRRVGETETLSPRAVQSLRSLGVDEALAAIEPPCAKHVSWAGTERELPGEALVDRASLDAGLLAALERRGVRVLRDRVTGIRETPDEIAISRESGGRLSAALAVDARGRGAPAARALARGPATTSLVQRFRVPLRDPRVCVTSLAEGWAWLADDGRGALAAQLTLAADRVPRRNALAGLLRERLESAPSCAALLRDAEPLGAPRARAATPLLHAALPSARRLRVGDALLAVDPLSGNGIFQALSSARVAPAVLNTIVQAPQSRALAERFFAERARDLFLRFGRVSRDFHRRALGHHGGAFFAERGAWPDGEPAHAAGSGIALAYRPVVARGFILEREVAITPERPLGTWRVADVEIAPLVREARAGRLGELGSLPPAARAPVRAWLGAHGLLPRESLARDSGPS